MLRCIKWLPLACLLIFSLCLGLGWIFGKPTEPPKGNYPPAPEKMSFIFSRSIYDMSGKPIPATTLMNSNETGSMVPIDKQTYAINVKRYIKVKPDDATHFQDRTFEVTWLNRTQFLAWLKNDFSKELTARGADLQKWQPILKKLESDASDTSCNYPVVLDRK